MTGTTTPPSTAAALPVQLALADQPLRQECVVVVQTGIRIGGVLYETASQLVVRKTRHQATPQGGVLELQTLDFAQEPTTELEELAGYLAQVKSRLLVEVDRTGRLRRVLNQEELQGKWQALKPTLAARYRASTEITPRLLDQVGEVLHGPGQLEEALGQAPEYGLLLPAIFETPYSRHVPRPGTAVLQQFLGELDLPLLTEARLAEPTSAATAGTLEVLGWCNAAQYPAAGVRQAVQALAGHAEDNSVFSLLYQEEYTLGLGPRSQVLHAASHTRYEVSGVIGREITTLLTILAD